MTMTGPAPRRSRTKVIVWSIVGGLVLLCACGGAGIFFFVKKVQQATAPAADAGNAFVIELEGGRYDAAYDLLCADTRERYTRETFTAHVQARRTITSHKQTGINVSSVNGRSTAVYSAKLTYRDGVTETHGFPLVKDSGVWRVCGSPI